MHPEGGKSPEDRKHQLNLAIVAALTAVAVALIAGAIVRDSSNYLGYLGGVGVLAFLWFALAQ